MLYFSRTLHVEDKGFLHFSFSRIVAPQKTKYHVSVLTRGPQCYHFVMAEDFGKWRIITAPQPPEWILALQEKLEEIIYEQQFARVLANESARVMPLPKEYLPEKYSLRKIG